MSTPYGWTSTALDAPSPLDLFLLRLDAHLAQDAALWVEQLTFGKPERELRATEDAFSACFGSFLPLSESSFAALERERLDTF